MNSQANIIIIGGGIIGAALAYHLAELGENDLVLLEKGELNEIDGSTGHAPGGLRVLTQSDWFTRLGSASRKLYDKMPPAFEGREHFFRTGSMQVAASPERFESYLRLQEMGLSYGEPTQILSAEEAHQVHPLLDPEAIEGAILIPNGGVIDTAAMAIALRRQAEATGRLHSYGNSHVEEVLVDGGRVCGVRTSNPEMSIVEANRVVLCSNIWAPLLCEKLGVNMPLFPGQHQYVYTEPLAELAEIADRQVALPVTTLDDISLYFRQHGSRLGIGSYHHKAMLVDPHQLGKKAHLPFTPSDFETAWSLIQKPLPPLKRSQVAHGFNGMFAFTVDGFPIVGESPIKGFWTSVGAWLSFAGELGRVLARWMTSGDPGMDMRMADIRRFHPFQTNREYVQRQSRYYYEIGFDVIHPNQVASSVRDLRLSPYAGRSAELGAASVPFAGIETANWYDSNADLVEEYRDRIPQRSGWDALYWSPIQGAEHLTLRENVGLVDWSAGIGPVEIGGPGATRFLNNLCSSRVDGEPGGITYTLWLTPEAGIYRDVTVVRWAEDRYWLMTGKSNLPLELAWMRRWAPADGSVVIQDRSNEFISLALWGPNARRVLEQVTYDDISDEAFPFYSARDIGVGMVPTRALRLSYAGEIGWELYAPNSYGVQLWDTLWEAGKPLHMRACGVASVLSARLEKAYRLYGADLTPEIDPFSAGLSWMVDGDRESFIGSDAIDGLKNQPTRQRLVTLSFADPATVLYRNDPIFVGDEVVGRITSGDFGYAVGRFIAFALVRTDYVNGVANLRARNTGRFFEGTIEGKALYDPHNLRLRS